MKTASSIIIILLALMPTIASAQAGLTHTGRSKMLIDCAYRGKLDSCKLLISKGVDVNYTNLNGETALLTAAMGGHVEIIQLLLTMGASTQYDYSKFSSPLMYACYQNNYEAAYLLARYTQNLDATDLPRNTALHYAVYSGNTDMVEMLLHYGASANLQNKNGNTPLHFAMYIRDTIICKLLIEHGADIEAKNRQGYTPLLLAAEQKNNEVFKLLYNQGAQINAMRTDSLSPLGIAIVSRNPELIDFILGKEKKGLTTRDNVRNPGNLARLHLTHSARSSLKKHGYRSQLAPLVYQSSIHFEQRFNGEDRMFHLSMQYGDIRNRLVLGLGYTGRRKVKEVLIQNGDGGEWREEKKQMFELSLRKEFPVYLHAPYRRDFGFYMGVAMQGSFNFQFSDQKIFWIAQSGLYYKFQNMRLHAGYTYSDYSYAFISPHYAGIGCSVFLRDDRPVDFQAYVPSWF